MVTELETLGLALGAGLAALGVTGPALGASNIAGKMLEGAARQPEHTEALAAKAILFVAIVEALGLFAWLIGIIFCVKVGF
ncbi:MAG: ATP synthase F0 subunit C [Candidatus Caenarcaniphilales bacterium]|jgi:F-type H+-transporting ATPase subunit c|nr:ATP synthase F0 subunit C [Candidatus Caenarcaniphilales bacterium]